jgi:predicted DNA-binding transcriptional regulator AlpA
MLFHRPPDSPIVPAVLTEAQAAEYLGLSRATLRRSRMQGSRDKHCPTPPFVRLGRAIRYRKVDLDKFLEAHLVGTGGAR